MADKEYKPEGGLQMGASLTPMIDDIYLIDSEDVHIGEGKSLAEYIEEGGGGSGGSGLPDYTSDDEGKFLRIEGGEPVWVAIPNAEEAKF